ncbi:unnamed protein product [Xylocopa violacea]|uniref:COMM domain-containing protein 3 n=1 Tax=Xylocopa violacea TaxID=135666 RepID=A0ABP1P8I8_XYLVO
MELSRDTIDGLFNILNKNIFTDDNFLQILEMAVSYIYENPAEIKCVIKTSDSKPILTKKILADVVCLLVEATRQNIDEENLKNFLNVIHVDETRSKKLCEVYCRNKAAIQSQLELIGNNPPHIVDIDWHLDYCIKVIDQLSIILYGNALFILVHESDVFQLDTCNSLGIPLYHVRFSTKEYETTSHVTFSCTIQQLQELVFKLKDAIRYSERLTNV